jgi:SAM-dependent methyltransferase
MSSEQRVADHYAAGDLLAAIRVGVEALGKTESTVSVEDLAPVDEFHIGGRAATTELLDRVGVTSESEVLDIGCGIGGTSRFVASRNGCRVTGIDLTPSYVDVATELTRWTGLVETTRFEVGSALEMPFDDESFDRAVQLHVGMNISDKVTLFEEVYRVLKPGSRFGVYDIMGMSDEEISFPVPWATDSSTSFVSDISTYREALSGAGFDVTEERNRGDFAVDFFAALKARTASAGGPPPLGLHLIMGADAMLKISNMVEAVGAGTLAPVEMICDKPAG